MVLGDLGGKGKGSQCFVLFGERLCIAEACIQFAMYAYGREDLIVSILCLESKDTAACDGAALLYNQRREIHLQLRSDRGQCVPLHTRLCLFINVKRSSR